MSNPDEIQSEKSSTSSTQTMGIGEAKKLIREKLNLIVDEHDPVMMFVLLEQAFHTNRENQFKAHLSELSKMVETSSALCMGAVNDNLTLLKDDALKSSLENTLAAVSQKAKENDRVVQKIRA
ncbi:MAG: hypothetical protein JKX94_11630, partial [Sneathiella sp.]|nr:hypothetical protein [Sneathiella sp.]